MSLSTPKRLLDADNHNKSYYLKNNTTKFSDSNTPRDAYCILKGWLFENVWQKGGSVVRKTYLKICGIKQLVKWMLPLSDESMVPFITKDYENPIAHGSTITTDGASVSVEKEHANASKLSVSSKKMLILSIIIFVVMLVLFIACLIHNVWACFKFRRARADKDDVSNAQNSQEDTETSPPVSKDALIHGHSRYTPFGEPSSSCENTLNAPKDLSDPRPLSPSV